MTKLISYDGVAAATTDEVADALLELALVTDPAEVELDGAPRTAADLRRRAEAFTDPFFEHPSGRAA